MTTVVWLKVILSFIVGGLYIGLITRVSEKVGSKLGGLILGMPSIVLVGLAFIAWTGSPSDIFEATTLMPATMGTSTLFLVMFCLLIKKGIARAYIASIIMWFVINIPMIYYKHLTIGLSIAIAVLFYGFSLVYFRQFPNRKLPKLDISRRIVLYRVIFSGTLVGLAVLFANTLGPLWGGLFASFPAAFSSSVLIFGSRYGRDFTASVSKTMVLGGVTNVIFVICLHFIILQMSTIAAFLTAYTVCLISAYFFYNLTSKAHLIQD